MDVEIINKYEFDTRLVNRIAVKRKAIEIKELLLKSNRLALELLRHPDTTPEQLWELHNMIVDTRQKALELEGKLQKHFLRDFKILGE
jgi:hypothetical protein